MTATLKTWYIATDAVSTTVEAKDADEAARIFAAEEGIRGVTDADGLREAIESVDGILYALREAD